MKIFKQIAVFLIIILTGCDRGSAYYYSINNRSKEDITVCFSYNFDNGTQCRIIKSGDSLVYDSIFVNNKGRDYGDKFLKQFYDTLSIKSIKKLNDQIYSRIHWTFNSSNYGKVGVLDSKINKYSLTITEVDFKK